MERLAAEFSSAAKGPLHTAMAVAPPLWACVELACRTQGGSLHQFSHAAESTPFAVLSWNPINVVVWPTNKSSSRVTNCPTSIMAAQLAGAARIIVCASASPIDKRRAHTTIHPVVDHINWSGDNPLIGIHDDAGSNRFVDVASVYRKFLLRLKGTLDEHKGIIGHGVVYLEGPSQGDTFPITGIPDAAQAFSSEVYGSGLVTTILTAAFCRMEVWPFVAVKGDNAKDTSLESPFGEFLEFCKLLHCYHN